MQPAPAVSPISARRPRLPGGDLRLMKVGSRKFALDSALEEGGFEPSVPSATVKVPIRFDIGSISLLSGSKLPARVLWGEPREARIGEASDKPELPSRVELPRQSFCSPVWWGRAALNLDGVASRKLRAR